MAEDIVPWENAPQEIVLSRPAWARYLNYSEYRFVREYILDFDMEAAAARARPKYAAERPAQLAKWAPRVFRRYRVAEAIDVAMRTLNQPIRNKILEEMSGLAFHNPKDYFRQNADGEIEVKPLSEITDRQARAITEISHQNDITDMPNGVTHTKSRRRLKLTDKQGALDKLAKAVGLYADQGSSEAGGVVVNVSIVNFSEQNVPKEAG